MYVCIFQMPKGGSLLVRRFESMVLRVQKDFLGGIMSWGLMKTGEAAVSLFDLH